MNTEYDTIRSPTALVGRREVASEAGGATIMCVVLADGFIIECGSSYYAEERARLLAEAINAFGPEKFLHR